VRTFVLLLALCITAICSTGQSGSLAVRTDADPQDMSGMKMDGMNMESHPMIQLIEHHAMVGTDVEPNSTPFDMLMTSKGNWTLMLHGVAFISDVQQTGSRGKDKLFSTNWIMPMAQRKLGNGTLTLRAMFSLEPATVSQRQYPLLFQQGETAFARPIVDGQHPHDFFMELAAMYDRRLSEKTLLSVYFAPMGDPALGPVAYPHRMSASENPVATLGHHLEDSTHIADEVITLGLTRSKVRVEASGFHGREPDEFRWDLDSGRIDSWATRVSANPGQNWSFQYSIGQLHSPEELVPREDVRRMTSSLMYNRPFRNGNWASTLLWGRNQSLSDVGNAYVAESTVRFGKNYSWTRIENADRTNELLLGENSFPTNFQERYFARVQAYTLGYDRDIGNLPHLATALGVQFTWYGVPDVLTSAYGSHPVGANVFLRVRAR
jgi:hypothetical protein